MEQTSEGEIRALAKHEAKTDRCDSDRLGKFQLRGILPESYLAPPEVRQRRERTRYRMALSGLPQLDHKLMRRKAAS